MSYECFDVRISDRVAHVVLNRPEKRNSMIPAFWDELPRIVKDIDASSRARVIVLSSTGPHFSAGLDLGSFGGGSKDDDPEAARKTRLQHGARFYGNVLEMQHSFSCLENCRVPVLACIQGGRSGVASTCLQLATCAMRPRTPSSPFSRSISG